MERMDWIKGAAVVAALLVAIAIVDKTFDDMRMGHCVNDGYLVSECQASFDEYDAYDRDDSFLN
jgi:hypothetical protein